MVLLLPILFLHVSLFKNINHLCIYCRYEVFDYFCFYQNTLLYQQFITILGPYNNPANSDSIPLMDVIIKLKNFIQFILLMIMFDIRDGFKF